MGNDYSFDSIGVEGEYKLCVACGRSIPVSEIAGQCKCEKFICKKCSDALKLCNICGWIMCKNCVGTSKKHGVIHEQCVPEESNILFWIILIIVAIIILLFLDQ